MTTIHCFLDYTSVDAYLSLDLLVAMAERDFPGVKLRWHPFPTRGPEFYCDAEDRVVTQDVKEHWKRKNPYLYAVAKHEAAWRTPPLPLRGPTDPHMDTTAALSGLLFLERQRDAGRVSAQALLHYHRCLFAAIWDPERRRDVSAPSEVASILAVVTTGSAREHMEGDLAGEFLAYWADAGPEDLRRAARAARDECCVFTVPTFSLPGPQQQDSPRDAAIHGKLGEVFVYCASLPLLRDRLAGRLVASVLPELGSIAKRPPWGEPVSRRLDVYVDVKSPYAYLAVEPTLQLCRDFHVEIKWLPFTLDIPSYAGSARKRGVETSGRKEVQNASEDGGLKRSTGQWSSVKYSYADVRRRAALRSPPLTVLGTQKIWDSSLAGIAMLWAQARGGSSAVEALFRLLWPRFWRRSLDVESPTALWALLVEAVVAGDADGKAFEAWAMPGGEGRRLHDEVRAHACEELGIFGVPTYVLHGEKAGPLWGSEHLDYLREKLYEGGCQRRADDERHRARL